MCTAFGIFDNSSLFGRTLDLDCSYGEGVVITPRNFCLNFLYEKPLPEHYAIIGAAVIKDRTPLYYDGVNEWGLCMAGLNFPQSARYKKPQKEMKNIASFELIPYILSSCKSVEEAKRTLSKINITADSFRDNLSATPLHWIVADKSGAVVAEPTESGLEIYDDPFCVLANEPPFPYHLYNLRGYTGLSPSDPKNTLAPNADLSPYSNGTGAIGLPGDFSSPSRFVRAVFAKNHCKSVDGADVCRFFHIAHTISVPSGCVINAEGKDVRTVYTCCMDADAFAYHYTTYDCPSIRSVSALPYLEGNTLTEFSMTD